MIYGASATNHAIAHSRREKRASWKLGSIASFTPSLVIVMTTSGAIVNLTTSKTTNVTHSRAMTLFVVCSQLQFACHNTLPWLISFSLVLVQV